MTDVFTCSYCRGEFANEQLALEHRKICPPKFTQDDTQYKKNWERADAAESGKMIEHGGNAGKEYVYYGIILLFLNYIGSQIWANEYNCNISSLEDYATCWADLVWWIRIFSFIELLGFCLCFWGLATMIELIPSNKQ